MVPDVSAFITAYTVCTQNKTPRQAPSSLLQPLLVPHRPGSHISLDFVTGLPRLDGNTVILMVVDRLSKAAQFIPLPKLPSAKETAQLMVQHVFRIHGKHVLRLGSLVLVVLTNPTTWSRQLVWVEYVQNTIPSSATGLSPFECSMGYQPPLFPEQEQEVSVPSAQMFVRLCRNT